MTSTPAAPPPRWAAGRWQREHARELRAWRASGSSQAHSNLTSICQAVNKTVWQVATSAQAIGGKLHATRARCNDLTFHEPDEAAAYAAQHLADRYGRVTQVLEQLFTAGHLPIRRERMTVLEVGAGPAPGLYAVRDFYADLVQWSTTTGQDVTLAPVTLAHALDRGEAWGQLLHSLSENLIALRHPAALGDGALHFHLQYRDLDGFSPRRIHQDALENLALRIAGEFDYSGESITRGTARQFAQEVGVTAPSAYDLVVMCNFLTEEGSVERFGEELHQIAHLSPGGLFIVIGHPAGRQAAIWRELHALMRGTGLTRIDGFEQPIHAHPRPATAESIHRQRLEIFDRLRQHNALLDVDAHLGHQRRFSDFRALVWKNQKTRRGSSTRQPR